MPIPGKFCTALHATTLAGGIPTLLNPTYREREVRFQLENSGAVILITDGGNLEGIGLGGLFPTLVVDDITRPELRQTQKARTVNHVHE